MEFEVSTHVGHEFAGFGGRFNDEILLLSVRKVYVLTNFHAIHIRIALNDMWTAHTFALPKRTE